MSKILYKFVDNIDNIIQYGSSRNINIVNNLDEYNNNFDIEYEKICKNKYTPSILNKVQRIVVFGDIHGDYNLIKKLLLMSKVVEINLINNQEQFKWIGNKTYVVQVGDQIDRCRPIASNQTCDNPNTTLNDENSDFYILKLMTDLDNQAKKVGGRVISLLGNHEIMNSLGYMDYVSYKGLEGFKKYKDIKNPNKKFKNGLDARKYAFAPGHDIGTFLGCTRDPAIIIGSNLFVHAGLIDGFMNEIGLDNKQDFETINIAIRKWLLGLLDVKFVNKIINGSESMFWTRLLGNIPENTPLNDPVCINNLNKVLQVFRIDNMIIGHTPQSFIFSDNINGTCDNKIWRVDNGSSAAFDKFDLKLSQTGKIENSRRPQYLEILNDNEFIVHDN